MKPIKPFVMAGMLILAPLSQAIDIPLLSIPTFDYTTALQSTQTAIEAIEQTVLMVEQLEQMARDYEQFQRQVESLRSVNGLKRLLNNPLDQELRRLLPPSWQAAADQLNGSSPYRESFEAVKERYQVQLNDRFNSASQPNWYSQNQNLQRTAGQQVITSLAASETAFNSHAARQGQVNQFIDEIDNQEDIKAAQDLTNRLLAEQLNLMNQLVQLLAVQIKVQGAHALQSVEADSASQRFNRNLTLGQGGR